MVFPDEGGAEVQFVSVDERPHHDIDAIEGDGGVGRAGVVHNRRAQVERRADSLLRVGGTHRGNTASLRLRWVGLVLAVPLHSLLLQVDLWQN